VAGQFGGLADPGAAANEMRTRFELGQLVEYHGSPGIGRVAGVDDDHLRIDFFESIAEPVAESDWVPKAACNQAVLGPETRVYWRNPDTGDWLAGRVKGASSDGYFIQFPNTEFDFPLPVGQLRVRWDRPIRDPVTVLATGGNESAYFTNARLPLLRNLIEQRAASASTFSLLSSAVELYPHQVHAALTVLSDPVQRYLLADEVGLGKTIEAGLVIRQTLIDNPRARIAVLTPDVLRRQWIRELAQKFFIDDFPHAEVNCVAHELPGRWNRYHNCDLVVVDEAHRLVQVTNPEESPYPELCALAHSARRLLLLSATPVTSQFGTHLGLLHLLDPDLYRWTETASFQRRHELRSRLADAVYGLDSEYTYLLRSTINDIHALLPDNDAQFGQLSQSVLGLLDENDELKQDADPVDLKTRVEALRAHISETYRLHRRIIRNRRDKVLQDDPASELIPYEVRGRQLPGRLVPRSDAQEAMRMALLEWQSAVWDRLLDAQATEYADAYALVLAVLTSRAAGLADDFTDILRWRTRRDEVAAERAGLTVRERAILADPEILGAEHAVLSGLEARLDGSADQHRDLDDLVDALLHALRASRRAVIFGGPGSLAGVLARRLRNRFPRVDVHEHTRLAEPENREHALASWSSVETEPGRRQVLVADDSAEDGLNLQLADAVIHVRLPWSPNQLEQRLGRVDRYPGTIAGSLHVPARQYLISDTDGDESFPASWAQLLQDGYQIFSGSVSTLQDAIAASLGGTWARAVEQGPPGLTACTDRVRADLAAAREEIDKIDMLESIHETSIEGRDIAISLNEIEQSWRAMRDAILQYTAEGDGGIRLRHYHRTVVGCRQDVFDLRESRPLLGPRQWHWAIRRVTPAMAQGIFNRSTALRAPGTRLLRRGNPLVDVLAEFLAVDDSGQASAFRRVDPDLNGDPEPYFGFDYLVEADISGALRRVFDQPGTASALRRQADRLLAPFTLRVWIAAGTKEPVPDGPVPALLNRPYDKRTGDRNYNGTRIRELIDMFGTWDSYRRAAEAAESVARDRLADVTDLQSRCSQARDQALQRVAVARAQAQARQAAGHLVGDSESYVLDVAITQALIEGLSRPEVRTVGATCVVRAGIKEARRGF
jgi:ATP-dependent helicase HepA